MHQAQKRNRRIVVSFTEAEFALFEQHFKATTAGSYSEYARAVLMHKPVILKTHNISVDRFLDSMIDLKKDLKIIIDQVSGRIEREDQILGSTPVEDHQPEIRLRQNVEAILSMVSKLYESWLQLSI